MTMKKTFILTVSFTLLCWYTVLSQNVGNGLKKGMDLLKEQNKILLQLLKCQK